MKRRGWLGCENGVEGEPYGTSLDPSRSTALRLWTETEASPE